MQWQAAVSAGNVFYAAGYEGRNLVVEQGFWDGRHVRLEGGPWEGLPLAHRPILLAPDPRGQRPLVVCVVDGPPLPQQSFPVADALLGRVRAGTPSWIPSDTIAVQRTSSGVTHVLQRQAGGLVLHFIISRTSRWVPASCITARFSPTAPATNSRSDRSRSTLDRTQPNWLWAIGWRL